MAKLKSASQLTTSITLELTEGEGRALAAIAGYAIENFLDVFYEHMGRSYLEPYEKDLEMLFDSVTEVLEPILDHLDAIKKSLEDGL